MALLAVNPGPAQTPAPEAPAEGATGQATESPPEAVREQALERAVVRALEPLLMSYKLKPSHRRGTELPKRYEQIRDGWLNKRSIELFELLNPELFTSGSVPENDPVAHALTVITDVRRQLAQHDVELLVVPLPGRMNIYPDALADVELGESFSGFAPGFRRFIELLRAEDIEVLDLLPVLSARRGPLDAPQDELVFLRMNGHWTPKGCALGAQAIAQEILARPWFEAAAESSSRMEPYTAQWEPTGEQLPEGVEPPTLTFQRVVDATGALVERKHSGSPVILWGDSFSSIYEAEGADLPRHLHHALGHPLDVIAIQGGGPDATRKAFSRRRAALDGKRLVIWTFATRSLVKSKWHRIRLHTP